MRVTQKKCRAAMSFPGTCCAKLVALPAVSSPDAMVVSCFAPAFRSSAGPTSRHALAPIARRPMAAFSRQHGAGAPLSRKGFSSSSLIRTPASTSSPASSIPEMSWPEFLRYRKSQRRYALFASIPTTALGLSLGVSYFATVEAVPTETIMGIEPIYAYGIATIGCTMLGYLCGPTLGNFFFRLRLSSAQRAQFQAKNPQFYAHIKRNRVDPSRQSVNNPVPDWFGEKIGSFGEYRRWLRDQAAYRRKAAQHGMLVGKGDERAGRDLL